MGTADGNRDRLEATELRVDVTPPGSAEVAELAVSVFAPPQWAAHPVALFCAHGGTYSRRYWDFHVDGHPGYSFARHLASQGVAVITFDELGAGESTRPSDPWLLTSFEAAAAQHALVEQITPRLADGSLAGTAGPAGGDLVTVGVGHSLGGFLTVRQQGQHRSHDAVAILGWTNLGLSITPSFDESREPLRRAVNEICAGVPRAEIELVLAREFRDRELPAPNSTAAHRDQVRANFYFDDVPAEVIAADDEASRVLASRSGGPLGLAVNVADIVADDAGSIDVPVLLSYGERDVSPDPRAEPRFYQSSGEVLLQLLPSSGHCHNFASTRTHQWDWIAGWAHTVAAARTAPGRSPGAARGAASVR